MINILILIGSLLCLFVISVLLYDFFSICINDFRRWRFDTFMKKWEKENINKKSIEREIKINKILKRK